MVRKTKPWKQSFRSLPETILQRARALGGPIQAGIALRLKPDAIAAGDFEHLGLELDEAGNLICPSDALPPAEVGPWSRRNLEGWEEVHRDQPKEGYSWSVDSPNWGDWYYGSHTVTFSGERYPRTFHPPRYARIQMELLAVEADGRFNVRFSIDEPLDPAADEFEAQLHELGNLLQENVGAFGIERAGATPEDYLATLHVNWQILPPGEREEVVRILVGGDGTPETRRRLQERMDVMQALRPQAWVVGSEGFQRYFGAKLADDLVVFENLEYGNAVYVMGGDWEANSRRSRTELLSDPDADFARIVHKEGWERALNTEVQARR